MTGSTLLTDLIRDMRLNAAAFIVTVYGDIVVPRGGMLWTGTLIGLCARVGINESLVRTAISRLVAASQLRGERIGRRSYYRLDDSARAAFDQAAGLLYGPEVPCRGWQVLHAPDITPDTARRMRMGHMGGAVFIRPDRGQSVPEGALLLRADDISDPAALARFWDLTALRDGYAAMLARFAPVEQALASRPIADVEALTLRLLLTHDFRHVLLRDPRLPKLALPQDWNGHEARALFGRLYLNLTPGAERHVASNFKGENGRIPANTPETAARLAELESLVQ